VVIPEPVKYLTCCRCARTINPLMVRYLWVGWGERGACNLEQKGNALFRRQREQSAAILCGPCGNEFRQQFAYFRLGRAIMQSLDSFERGVVRD